MDKGQLCMPQDKILIRGWVIGRHQGQGNNLCRQVYNQTTQFLVHLSPLKMLTEGIERKVLPRSLWISYLTTLKVPHNREAPSLNRVFSPIEWWSKETVTKSKCTTRDKAKGIFQLTTRMRSRLETQFFSLRNRHVRITFSQSHPWWMLIMTGQQSILRLPMSFLNHLHTTSIQLLQTIEVGIGSTTKLEIVI